MRRADRLFQIVQHLRSGRLMTAARLAERLQVSIRTIYRDIRDLSLSGVPIEGEAGVGYMLRRGFDVPPLMFTAEELEALTISARMAQAWAGPELARAVSEALEKIEAVLPERLQQGRQPPRMFAPDYEAQPWGDKLDVVRKAINSRSKLQLKYESLEGDCSERQVWPLGLFFWGKVWTLAAWCELRRDYRSFRIDRISELALPGEQFAESEQVSLRAFLARYKDSS